MSHHRLFVARYPFGLALGIKWNSRYASHSFRYLSNKYSILASMASASNSLISSLYPKPSKRTLSVLALTYALAARWIRGNFHAVTGLIFMLKSNELEFHRTRMEYNSVLLKLTDSKQDAEVHQECLELVEPKLDCTKY